MILFCGENYFVAKSNVLLPRKYDLSLKVFLATKQDLSLKVLLVTKRDSSLKILLAVFLTMKQDSSLQAFWR